MFNAVPTARVIFTAKTSLDLSDEIHEMRYLYVAVGHHLYSAASLG